MDFEKFIEKDIVEFLDEQSRKLAEKAAGLREEEFELYEITQDYSKEITQALEERDLRKAQKIFEDVKNKYLKAPADSLSRKRLYIIMEEIYERIRDYESKEEGKKSLFETIREYKETGLFSKPELFQKNQEARLNLLLDSIEKKDKQIEEIAHKKIIEANDLRKAILIYRELKNLISKIPNTHAKQKSKAYESALSWYYTIKKIKQRFVTGEGAGEVKKVKKAGKPEKEEVPLEQQLLKVRKLKEEIVKSHTLIADYLKKKDLNKSIQEYEHLKKLCETFPEEMEDEKTALLADAMSLYESIKKLKQGLGDKQEREQAYKEEEQREKSDRNKMRRDIHESLRKIKEYLEKKDATNAVREYKELKEVFKSYPEHPPEDKKHLYEEILGTHRDIQFFEDDLKKKNPAQTSSKEKISNIDKGLEEANALLDKSRVEEATHKLLEAKHKIEMLPKEAFDEKYRLLKKTEEIEHKMLFVKNIHRINAPSIPQHR